MKDPAFGPTSVLRYVAAFLAVKLTVGSGLALYALATETEPSISSIPITIVAVGVAMLWYSKVANRPMSGSEILTFSVGTTLVEILLSGAWIIGMVWLLAVPLSWKGVEVALGGSGDGQTGQFALTIGVVVGSIQVFALSAAFAWLLSRNLPRGNPPSVESE